MHFKSTNSHIFNFNYQQDQQLIHRLLEINSNTANFSFQSFVSFKTKTTWDWEDKKKKGVCSGSCISVQATEWTKQSKKIKHFFFLKQGQHFTMLIAIKKKSGQMINYSQTFTSHIVYFERWPYWNFIYSKWTSFGSRFWWWERFLDTSRHFTVEF